MKIFYKINSVIIMAALCSLIPIIKSTIVAKLLAFNDLNLYFTHISLMSLLSPVFSFAIVDYFYRRENHLIQNDFYFLIVSNSTSIIIGLFLALYLKIQLRVNDYIIFLFLLDILHTSVFNNFIKHFRVKFEPYFIYNITLIRATTDIVVLLFVIIFLDISLQNVLYSSIFSTLFVICYLSIAHFNHVSQNIITHYLFVFEFLKSNLRDWFSFFLLVSISSFSVYFDKIIAQQLLPEIEFINYNFLTFSRAIILSGSAFLFTYYYKKCSSLNSSSEWWSFFYSSGKITTFLLVPFFIINSFYLFFYIENLNYSFFIFSFIANILFFSFFLDLFVFIKGSSLLRYLYGFSYLTILVLACIISTSFLSVYLSANIFCFLVIFSKILSLLISSFIIRGELR